LEVFANGNLEGSFRRKTDAEAFVMRNFIIFTVQEGDETNWACSTHMNNVKVTWENKRLTKIELVGRVWNVRVPDERLSASLRLGLPPYQVVILGMK
jgi:hypothetical protein